MHFFTVYKYRKKMHLKYTNGIIFYDKTSNQVAYV